MAFTSTFLLTFRTRLPTSVSSALRPKVLAHRHTGMPARMSSSGIKDPKSLTEKDWKERLSPEQYYILRQKGTERAGTGEYNNFVPPTEESYFACAACNNPLYSAQSKFKSGCGWPSFDQCYEGSVETEIDNSFGMRRIEIMCANCGGHLGHVFEGERMTPTNERHCVNSVSSFYSFFFVAFLLTP